VCARHLGFPHRRPAPERFEVPLTHVALDHRRIADAALENVGGLQNGWARRTHCDLLPGELRLSL
jgi:hypothetical protein